MLKRIFRKNTAKSNKTLMRDESGVDRAAFGLKELSAGVNPIVDITKRKQWCGGQTRSYYDYSGISIVEYLVTANPRHNLDTSIQNYASDRMLLSSIVAVHGLNGHRENTWTADNGVNWLKHLLPKKIPNARIFTYGYDARTHGFVSQQTLRDHGLALVSDLSSHREMTGTERRPIIFVAHSLGGIICKIALIHANTASESHLKEHKSIHLSTYGILYFGTPHQGGNGVSLGKFLVNIASVFVITNKSLLKHLEMNSEMLLDQTSQYNAISSQFKTKFFYETNETITPFGSILLVPKYSAVIPGTANAEEVPINGTHQQMVRYRSFDDEGFKRTFTALALMLREAASVVENKWRRYYKQNDLGPFITSHITDDCKNPDITTTRITSIDSFNAQVPQRPYTTVGPQRVVTYLQGVMYTTEVPQSRGRRAIT